MFLYRCEVIRHGFPDNGVIELRWDISGEDGHKGLRKMITINDLKDHESLFDYLFEDSKQQIIKVLTDKRTDKC